MAKMFSNLCGCVQNNNKEVDDREIPTESAKLKGLRFEETCTDIAYIPNTHIVCGKEDGSLLAYNYTDDTQHRSWEGHKKSVTKICIEHISGDGFPRYMFSSSRDLSMKMWNIERNERIRHCEQEFVGHHDLVITAVACHPDNRDIICSGSRDNSLALWDVSTGAVTNSTKIARNLVTDMCWKGDLLAQTSEDKSLRLWDARTLQPTLTFAKKQQILTSCDVNGSQIVTSCGGFNGSGCEITLWDSRNGTMPVHEFKGHSEKVYKCCFVTGTNYVASVSADRTIKIWNLATNSEQSLFQHGFSLSSLIQLPSEDPQSLWFALGSLESGVMIITTDLSSCREWQIYE